MRGLIGLALALGLLAGVSVAQAAGVDALRQFLKETRTLQAGFSQQVTARHGRAPQSSSGSVLLSRPGRLRWEITQPYPQLMIGEGGRFLIYDPELQQLTIRKLGEALGSTPAAFLSGGVDVDRNFQIHEGGERDGLAWAIARPKAGDGGFEELRFGFAGSELKAMELIDHFGQTTRIRLHQVVRNAPVDAARFRFTPPAGVDVVGD